MIVLRVLWLVFLVVNLVIIAWEVRYENNTKMVRVWYAIPLRLILSLFGPVYIAIQIGAINGGNSARRALFDLFKSQGHCPLCGACRHEQDGGDLTHLKTWLDSPPGTPPPAVGPNGRAE